MKILDFILNGERHICVPPFLRGMGSIFDIAGSSDFISMDKQPTSEESHFSGPIPDPEQLKAYNEVAPGMADRILQMTEEEQKHRFMIERCKIRAIARGQYTAFVIVILLIAAGVACALSDHHVIAGTIFTTTIIGTASVFLLGRKTVKEEEK